MRNTFMAGVILSTCVHGAQSARFETASLTKSRSAGEGYSGHLESKPGQPVKLTLQNVTLAFLIQHGFSVKDYQIAGPGWIRKARYDVEATLPPRSTVEQVWAALQTLLEERLKVSIRREEKELLLYAMTVAKDGPKLHPATGAGAEAMKFQPGGRQGVRRSARDANGSLQLSNASVPELCDRLSRSANHPVVDRTGLAGRFDFDLQYSGTSSSTMSRALEKQFGLKLEPTKGTVEMLVVEAALRKPGR